MSSPATSCISSPKIGSRFGEQARQIARGYGAREQENNFIIDGMDNNQVSDNLVGYAPSVDAIQEFNEITSNFQEVTLQGQLTYRIHEPKKAAALLNLRIDPDKYSYVTEDLNALAQKIINVFRIETRSEVERRALAEVLRDSRAIAALKAGVSFPSAQ